LRRASWRSRSWLRLMQFTMPFGLPRWREWCGGGPTENLPIRRALTCRPEYMKNILREDEAFPAAAKEIREITGLGSLPLIVIAADRAKGNRGKRAEGHLQRQRGLATLSGNSQFVVAADSGHDVPIARPEVVTEAVRSLIKPQEQPDSRETP